MCLAKKIISYCWTPVSSTTKSKSHIRLFIKFFQPQNQLIKFYMLSDTIWTLYYVPIYQVTDVCRNLVFKEKEI
jgi:hypothetical protein